MKLVSGIVQSWGSYGFVKLSTMALVSLIDKLTQLNYFQNYRVKMDTSGQSYVVLVAIYR